MAKKGEMREGPHSTFADRVFDAQINEFITKSDADYERMLYRNVTVHWHTFKDAKEAYVLICEANKEQLNRGLIEKWIGVMAVVMAPITSHTSEFLWRTVLGNKGSVFNERFPVPGKLDASIIQGHEYIERTVAMLRAKLGTHNAPPKKKDFKPNPPAIGARLYLCSSLPEWQSETISVVKKLYDDAKGNLPTNNEIAAALKTKPLLVSNMKKAMPFANNLKESVAKSGATAFDLALSFSEKDVCDANSEYLRNHGLGGVAKLQIIEVTDESQIPENSGKKVLMPEPGKPLVYFDTA